MSRCACAFVLVSALALAWPRHAAGYSVLAHEAMIDAAWEAQMAPLLTSRFPSASPEAVQRARAYAYGGSLIQDLGYYPFGSKLFSTLVPYVRSGTFVQALVREARDVNEYAFALGALAHFASDNTGHPHAINRVVPMMYPKLAAAHGPEVLYAASPARHVMIEFAFDVVQVARGTFTADVYQDLVGFEVATPVLERAVRATYGLELKDLFGDVDLAIGTYRRAASTIVPDITRMAWRDKREDILRANPALTEQAFVFTLTSADYDKAYGTNYRKPSLFARIVVALFKVIPKFGPFRPLAFEPLTPDAERVLMESFEASRGRLGEYIADAEANALALRDTDLDTGAPPARGVNPLADQTFDDLLERVAKVQFAGTPPELRHTLQEHYASGGIEAALTRSKKTARYIAALNAVATN